MDFAQMMIDDHPGVLLMNLVRSALAGVATSEGQYPHVLKHLVLNCCALQFSSLSSSVFNSSSQNGGSSSLHWGGADGDRGEHGVHLSLQVVFWSLSIQWQLLTHSHNSGAGRQGGGKDGFGDGGGIGGGDLNFSSQHEDSPGLGHVKPTVSAQHLTSQIFSRKNPGLHLHWLAGLPSTHVGGVGGGIGGGEGFPDGAGGGGVGGGIGGGEGFPD